MSWSATGHGARVQRPRIQQGLLIPLLTTLIYGCSSGPSALTPPRIDADAAAAEAMKQYDKNQDGVLADAELDAAPELKGAMRTLDENGDGKVTESEIAARIASWEASGVGATTVKCTVTLDGRPLSGATITFKPAAYLGDGLPEAFGATTLNGMANLSVPKEKRVPADAPPGLAQGFYLVSISKVDGGREQIPAKYNEQTELGMEVSLQNPDMMSDRVRFELKR